MTKTLLALAALAALATGARATIDDLIHIEVERCCGHAVDSLVALSLEHDSRASLVVAHGQLKPSGRQTLLDLNRADGGDHFFAHLRLGAALDSRDYDESVRFAVEARRDVPEVRLVFPELTGAFRDL